MQAVAAPKKKPTPVAFKIDPEKIYEFELSRTFEQARPTERGTNNAIGEPYPRVVTYPNFGIAIDPVTGRARNWRYIDGQPSIWEDEQTTFDNYEKRDLDAILGREDNSLAIYDGHLQVFGINELKVQAMMLQNYFEGNTSPYNKTVSPEYRFKLLNPEQAIENSLIDMRKRYQVMNAAMEATDTDMLAVSSILGIDIEDRSEKGLKSIRLQFLKKAEFDPKVPKGIEFFMETLSNPATKVRYVFTEGIKKGIISTTQLVGKLTWAAGEIAITELEGRQAVADEMAHRICVDNDEKAIEVMKQIIDLLV